VERPFDLKSATDGWRSFLPVDRPVPGRRRFARRTRYHGVFAQKCGYAPWWRRQGGGWVHRSGHKHWRL